MPVLWQPAAACGPPNPMPVAIAELQGGLEVALALLHAHVVQRLLVHAGVLQRHIHVAQAEGARGLHLENPGPRLDSSQRQSSCGSGVLMLVAMPSRGCTGLGRWTPAGLQGAMWDCAGQAWLIADTGLPVKCGFPEAVDLTGAGRQHGHTLQLLSSCGCCHALVSDEHPICHTCSGSWLDLQIRVSTCRFT